MRKNCLQFLDALVWVQPRRTGQVRRWPANAGGVLRERVLPRAVPVLLALTPRRHLKANIPRVMSIPVVRDDSV